MKTKRIIIRIYDIVRITFIALLVLYLILGLCGLRTHMVSDSVMEPTIKTKSVCVVNTKAKYSKLKPGDLVLLHYNGTQSVRKIISEVEEGYITKADAMRFQDQYLLTSKELTGKVVLHFRFGYRLISFSKTAHGKISLGILFLAFVIMGYTIDTLEEDKKQNKKES